jgi:CubicO group peptidase (beta-lactamase class C family)
MADRLSHAFSLLDETPFPATAAAVVTRDEVVRQFVRGTANLETGEELTPEHFFDLASLTKVLVTLPEVLDLIERGRVSVSDPLALHLPDAGWMLGERSLGTVTIGQLLAHTSGLPGWMPLHVHPADRATLLTRVLQTPLARTPGEQCEYSCLGFIALGALVESLTGQRLDELAARRGWVTFQPEGPSVATERCPWRGRVLQGEVHDENAGALGGVSGNAGAFGRLTDVIRAAQAWLGDAVSPATRHLMTRQWSVEASGLPRGLGWLLGHPGCFAGELSSPEGFGHTGFTGTSLWVEPERGYAIVLLTNRVHPTRHTGDEIFHLRRRFGNAVHAAMTGRRNRSGVHAEPAVVGR